ncbi:hypothetical protein [Pararhizobium haloflavum]|uniref:hypothetical protein n=1 Tax=Pararhizobium haloflavum TaxID=2037914 RepID=UPI000C197E45|nr:hypothetical protein [Pararhizobium haloflavum]
MARRRTFSKAEIMDVARAASESGMRAKLHPTGEIEFIELRSAKPAETNSPEDILEAWKHGRQTRGRA